MTTPPPCPNDEEKPCPNDEEKPLDSQLSNLSYAYVDPDFTPFYDAMVASAPAELEVGVDTSFYSALALRFEADRFIKILDLACGTGRITQGILDNLNEAGRLGQVHAVDHSQAMLDALKESTVKFGNFVEASKQSMHEFYVREKIELAVISAGSFHHLTDREEQLLCLKSVHKALAFDGVLAISFLKPSMILEDVGKDGVFPVTEIAGFSRQLKSCALKQIEEPVWSGDEPYTSIMTENEFLVKHGEEKGKMLAWSLRTLSKGEAMALLKHSGFEVVQTFNSFKDGIEGKEAATEDTTLPAVVVAKKAVKLA